MVPQSVALALLVLAEASSLQAQVTAWWAPEDACHFPGDTVDTSVYVDLSATDKALGSYEATLGWDPSVLTYLSVNQGDFAGTFIFNNVDAGTGQLTIAGINTDPGANADTTRLAGVRMEVLGAPGTESPLHLEITLAAVDHTNLNLGLIVVDGRVAVANGMVGDPSKDGEITAVDALACIGHVVGLWLPSEFGPTLCDANGDRAFTALDALVILSYAVGKELPTDVPLGDPSCDASPPPPPPVWSPHRAPRSPASFPWAVSAPSGIGDFPG